MLVYNPISVSWPGKGPARRQGIGLRPIIGGTAMPRHRAFTLIEMLVVIAIIAILMGAMLAVGSSLRASATRRTTLDELHALGGFMKDYLAAGNPEPQVPAAWPYSTTLGAYAQTNPASDPCDWVLALRSDPTYRTKLDGFKMDNDTAIPKVSLSIPTYTLIMDSYGNPIRYVPSTATKPGYFMSAGPDGNWSMQTPPPSAPYRPDEIYSYDP